MRKGLRFVADVFVCSMVARDVAWSAYSPEFSSGTFNLSFGTRDRLTSLLIIRRALKRRVLECTLDDIGHPIVARSCCRKASQVSKAAGEARAARPNCGHHALLVM